MASYNKAYSTDYTTRVQNILQGLGADLGAGGVDGKWGAYTDAAYNQYKSQVDAALAGNPYSGGVTMNNSFTMPQISYKTRTLDEIMAEANGLVGGAYDAQMLRQTQGFETSKKQLAESYNTARNTTQDNAVARGMGRSSYLTDAIANVGVKEAAAVDELTGNYNDMMAQLEANKSNAIYSYATAQQQQEQQIALEAALAQAQLQYQYDALQAEKDMLEMQLKAAKSSGSSSKSTARETEEETYDPLKDPEWIALQQAIAEENQKELAKQAGGEEWARKLYGSK